MIFKILYVIFMTSQKNEFFPVSTCLSKMHIPAVSQAELVAITKTKA